MPNPFTHIVYADKILKDKLSDRHIDERAYFVGASFPDIRYFLKAPRNMTHTEIVEPEYFLDKIQTEKDPFELGILAHIYVDRLWEKHWLNFSGGEPDVYHAHYYSLCILADRELFDTFSLDRRESVRGYFKTVSPQEILRYPGADEAIVAEWHEFIYDVLNQKTDQTTALRFVRLFGKDEEFVEKIFDIYNNIKDDLNFIESFKNFEKIIQASPVSSRA